MNVSIIIPTKDRGEVFNKTLNAALIAVKNIQAEIIVINDSKTSRPVIPENNKHVQCINNPKHGVASARNLGASVATGEWLLFLDDDMLMSEENINSYLKYYRRNDKICINIEWVYPPLLVSKIKNTAFGRFLIKYGFTSMRGWNGNPQWATNSIVPINAIASPNLFINKKHFVDMGGYDEIFPFAGFEDYVFSKRLKEQKFKMYVDTTSYMYHNEEDRINSKEWLQRKVRAGMTRKIAVEQGFEEIEIVHNFLKKIFYKLTPMVELFVKFILFFSSPFKTMDRISFIFYKILLGISIYKGYNKTKI